MLEQLQEQVLLLLLCEVDQFVDPRSVLGPVLLEVVEVDELLQDLSGR